MIPDFPHIIKIRLAPLKLFFVGSWLCKVRTKQKKIIMGPILFLYYEESLVSSNLNSNLLTFHCAHPNKSTDFRIFLCRGVIPEFLGKAMPMGGHNLPPSPLRGVSTKYFRWGPMVGHNWDRVNASENLGGAAALPGLPLIMPLPLVEIGLTHLKI